MDEAAIKKLEEKKVFFLGEVCSIVMGQYRNGRLAIKLITKYEEPMGTSTLNIPEEPLNEDEVFIRDSEENEGMVKALLDAGVITEIIGYAQSGFIKVPKCKLAL